MYVAVVNDEKKDSVHCKVFSDYTKAEEWAQSKKSGCPRLAGAWWEVVEAEVDEPEGKGVVLLDKSQDLKRFSPCKSPDSAEFSVSCPVSMHVSSTSNTLSQLTVRAYNLPKDFSVGLNDRLHIVVTLEKGE